MADGAALANGGLSHLALYYRGRDEYVSAVTAFVLQGLRRGEPVFVAVPQYNLEALRSGLPAGSAGLVYADMARMGRNPARIIPEVQSFLDRHPDQHVRYLGEPAWPGRSDPELSEAAIHEGLIDLAFAGASVAILCPYDTAGLAPSVIAQARRTHPAVLTDGAMTAAAGDLGAHDAAPERGRSLRPPPAAATAMAYHAELQPVRHLVRDYASRAGLSDDRTASLVLAVSEIAANTLCHTDGGGMLYIWHDEHEVLCQLTDAGWITDPLAGRVRWPPDDEHGHGLWVVNQECDLVELRSSPAGTTVLLHMRRFTGQAA